MTEQTSLEKSPWAFRLGAFFDPFGDGDTVLAVALSTDLGSLNESVRNTMLITTLPGGGAAEDHVTERSAGQSGRPG